MSADKLDLQSPDLVNANFEKLAELFPNCVTETSEGKKIDFDILKQELCHQVIEGNKERYRLEWPGKREAIVTANLPTTNTLRPVREESIDFDNTENLYIEGDNLEVLKLLQESYLGKIKMIYIDPPYNTGKDFVYKDNFTKDTQEELFESGQKDEYSKRLITNPETSGRYHSDWLSMIYPRLKLARNLMKDDGVIFISIDDNEVHNLRKMCDEVFGETNFISNIIWQKKYAASNDAKYLSDVHDHILLYAKNKNLWKPSLFPRPEELDAKYSNPDNDPRGPWYSTNLSVKTYSEKNDYIIIGPTGINFSPPPSRCWVISEEKYFELLKDNRIWFGKEGNSRPYQKKFLTDVQAGIVPTTIWEHEDAGHNIGAKSEIRDLFSDTTGLFDTPKPTKLIYRILQLSNLNKGDIVLDFYSGSATTAHGILKYNAEYKKSIQSIQVQLPENVQISSESNSQYSTVCDIGKERIRRASKKIKDETNADIDYGFRVYRLDSSNMQDVYYRPQDYNQSTLDLFADNVKPDRTADDLLAQIMLDWGLPLSYKIEHITIAGKQVYKVAADSLYACFEKGIDEAFAKEISKDKPLRMVFRDSGFKDDTAKTNVKQLLKQLSPETEMKVI